MNSKKAVAIAAALLAGGLLTSGCKSTSDSSSGGSSGGSSRGTSGGSSSGTAPHSNYVSAPSVTTITKQLPISTSEPEAWQAMSPDAILKQLGWDYTVYESYEHGGGPHQLVTPPNSKTYASCQGYQADYNSGVAYLNSIHQESVLGSNPNLPPTGLSDCSVP